MQGQFQLYSLADQVAFVDSTGFPWPCIMDIPGEDYYVPWVLCHMKRLVHDSNRHLFGQYLEKHGKEIESDDYFLSSASPFPSTAITPSIWIETIQLLHDLIPKCDLTSDSLHCAHSMLSRLLNNKKYPIPDKHTLQLTALVCLWISAKVEETMWDPIRGKPSLAELAAMGKGKWTVRDVRQTECKILTALDFNVHVPNVLSYLGILQRLCCLDLCDRRIRVTARYLCDLSLFDWRFLSVSPLRLAAAATYLSMKCFVRGGEQGEIWRGVCVKICGGLTENNLLPLVKVLQGLAVEVMMNPSRHWGWGVYRLYSRMEFERVSSTFQPVVLGEIPSNKERGERRGEERRGEERAVDGIIPYGLVMNGVENALEGNIPCVLQFFIAHDIRKQMHQIDYRVYSGEERGEREEREREGVVSVQIVFHGEFAQALEKKKPHYLKYQNFQTKGNGNVVFQFYLSEKKFSLGEFVTGQNLMNQKILSISKHLSPLPQNLPSNSISPLPATPVPVPASQSSQILQNLETSAYSNQQHSLSSPSSPSLMSESLSDSEESEGSESDMSEMDDGNQSLTSRSKTSMTVNQFRSLLLSDQDLYSNFDEGEERGEREESSEMETESEGESEGEIFDEKKKRDGFFDFRPTEHLRECSRTTKAPIAAGKRGEERKGEERREEKREKREGKNNLHQEYRLLYRLSVASENNPSHPHHHKKTTSTDVTVTDADGLKKSAECELLSSCSLLSQSLSSSSCVSESLLETLRTVSIQNSAPENTQTKLLLIKNKNLGANHPANGLANLGPGKTLSAIPSRTYTDGKTQLVKNSVQKKKTGEENLMKGKNLMPSNKPSLISREQSRLCMPVKSNFFDANHAVVGRTYSQKKTDKIAGQTQSTRWVPSSNPHSSSSVSIGDTLKHQKITNSHKKSLSAANKSTETRRTSTILSHANARTYSTHQKNLEHSAPKFDAKAKLTIGPGALMAELRSANKKNTLSPSKN